MSAFAELHAMAPAVIESGISRLASGLEKLWDLIGADAHRAMPLPSAPSQRSNIPTLVAAGRTLNDHGMQEW